MSGSLSPLAASVLEHEQLAYLVDDVDWATAHLSTLLGLGEFDRWQTQLSPVGGAEPVRLDVAMVRHGARNIELLHPVSDCPELFAGFGEELARQRIVFHHVGMFAERSAIDGLLTAARSTGLAAHRYLRSNGGDVVFVDARPTLGHFIEVLAD